MSRVETVEGIRAILLSFCRTYFCRLMSRYESCDDLRMASDAREHLGVSNFVRSLVSSRYRNGWLNWAGFWNGDSYRRPRLRWISSDSGYPTLMVIPLQIWQKIGTALFRLMCHAAAVRNCWRRRTPEFVYSAFTSLPQSAVLLASCCIDWSPHKVT